MTRGRRRRVFFAIVVAVCGATAADTPLQRPPHDGGLREAVEAALGQLDISVFGPEAVITGLSKADFDVTIGGIEVEDFSLDPFCGPSARGGSAAKGNAAPAVVLPAAATYVFYLNRVAVPGNDHSGLFQRVLSR